MSSGLYQARSTLHAPSTMFKDTNTMEQFSEAIPIYILFPPTTSSNNVFESKLGSISCFYAKITVACQNVL